jgi:hypothetical protein
VEFAGSSTLGGGRFGTEEFDEENRGVLWPIGTVIAAGKSGRPKFRLTLDAGAEVLAVKFVETGTGQAQFPGQTAGVAQVASPQSPILR